MMLIVGQKVYHWYAGNGVIISFPHRNLASVKWNNGKIGIAYIKDLSGL